MKKYLNSAILLLLFITACGQINDGTKAKSHMSSSINSLERMIDFPLKITSVRWELESRNNETNDKMVLGPNDYTIYADIECNISDYLAFKNSFIKNKANLLNPDVYLEPTFIKPWFSKDTKLVFYKKGDYIQINVPTYKLNSNIIGKTFFKDGFFSFIGSDKILLVVYR